MRIRILLVTLTWIRILLVNLMDPDPTGTFHFDADPDPSFQIKAQNLEKALKQAHIPYILAYHLQTDADPDPAYHFVEDADPDPVSQHWFVLQVQLCAFSRKL